MNTWNKIKLSMVKGYCKGKKKEAQMWRAVSLAAADRAEKCEEQAEKSEDCIFNINCTAE